MFHLKDNKFNFKKTIIVVLVFVMLFSSVVAPKPAQAQLVEVGQAIWNAFKIPFDIFGWIYEKANYAYEKAGALGFRQALKNITHNIAVDSATYIVTGDKGQAPMFQQNFASYIKEEGDAFLGDALNNQIKKMWGVNLCEPVDPLFKIEFELAAKNYFRKTPPQCTFTEMKKNLGDLRFMKTYDLKDFSAMFNPNGNELGAFFEVTSQIQEGQKNQIELAKLDLTTNQGWKAITAKVSGNILTPPDFIKKISVDLPIDVSTGEMQVFTGELAADFIGPFANTLLSKWMKELKDGWLKDSSSNASGGFSSNTYGFNSTTQAPVQAAKERFAELGKPNYNFGGPFDLIAQLKCNDDIDSQYNCTIDESLSSALLEASYMTVKEALDNDFLYGDRAFGFRSDKSGGTDDANQNIYSYRNLVILRKYRIIPVGWELAAQYYLNFDKSGEALTLNKLTEAYYDSTSPYYRLVDPNWVLKAPETICEKEGFGELVSTETIKYQIDLNQDGDTTDEGENVNYQIRLPYCADERTCIKERSDGNGCLYFGYCTEEKPIWRIQSDSGECAPVYNSCRAYVTRDDQQVAYLSNTLWGQDECDLGSTGCREYSTVWDFAVNNWSDDMANRIYLNRSASDNQCDEQAVGCSRFIRLAKDGVFLDDGSGGSYSYESALIALQSGSAFETVINYDFSNKTNLKKAPNYLACEGYTVEVVGNEVSCVSPNFWRADINKCVESGNNECSQYAIYCDVDDAGCQFYIPQSYSGPQVPGIASVNDYCPAECVGYRNYLEQPSFLEPVVPVGRNPLSLIATTAETCSAVDNGCEEFTNLSEGVEGEQKEYFSAIRSCILPNNLNVATYYSWASTDEAGNQLRSWELLRSNTGEYPCTNSETAADGTVSCTDNLNTPYQCSFGSSDPRLNPIYNPDCVEYTASTGVSYWMLYSRVIFTSEDCVPMRRTNGGDIYSINQEQSQRCSESAKNCRQYKGSAANNIKIILSDNFDDGTQDWNGGIISTESLTAGGKSLLGSAEIWKNVAELLSNGKSYKLSFWAKSTAGATVEGIYINGTTINEFDLGGGITFGDEWNRYEVSLNNFIEPTSFGGLAINVGSASFYIDNIILTETQDDLYLIRDSWQTPASCEAVVDGRDMIGCEAYQDVARQNWYLRSFTKLCYDEVVGCEAMVDTYNNSTATELIFNVTENTNVNDNVVVPADDLKYLVYDQNKVCNQVGCTRLGLVEADRDSAADINYTTKYLIVDAQKFGFEQNPLCLAEENWCDEFARVDGGMEYFINPSVFTCEYKAVNGNYGWYQTGSDEFCPTINSTTETGYCLGGRSVLDTDVDNSCNEPSDCADYASGSQPGQCSQWVGICPLDQNNCTEYQDPANPVGCDKTSVYGEAFNILYNNNEACDFYYYQSDKVETCTENELGEGCQAFHQTDGGIDQWYSTPRCNGDSQIECEVDGDCVIDGTDYGTCEYMES